MSYEEATIRQRDRVLEGIIDLTISGQIPIGVKTSEIVVAKKLGVSRTPVREALAILVDRGVASQRPQVGVQINKVDPGEMAELIRMSHVVESLAIEELIARENLPIDKVAFPLGYLAVMSHSTKHQTEGSIDSFLKGESGFHETLTRAGLGATGAKMIALYGLKRRLFQISNPIDASVVQAIVESDIALGDALLRGETDQISPILDDYYSTQLVLTGHAG